MPMPLTSLGRLLQRDAIGTLGDPVEIAEVHGLLCNCTCYRDFLKLPFQIRLGLRSSYPWAFRIYKGD